MTTLSKYQRPSPNWKTTKKNSTILCLEITPPKIQNPSPNSPATKFPPNTQSQLTGLYSKWQKSVKQKECSPTKVLCKRSSFSFLYKKAQIKQFLRTLKIIYQKFLEKISNYPNCVIMQLREQNKFMRWWTTQFSINYSGGTDKDT